MSDDAIRRYERELAEDPQSRAFAPLAEAHRKAGHLEEAIRVARAGLEAHPGYSGGLVVLGRALYEKGELDNAAEILQKAVSETPESYLGQKFLGKVLLDKGENKGALKALGAANLLSPEDEEVARLLDEVRSKAASPPTMEYEGRLTDPGEEAQIVTYEQKPTTVDGVELPPLPAGGDEGVFSFSSDGTVDPVEITPAPVTEGVGPADSGMSDISMDEFEVEDMNATVIDEEEFEQAMHVESLGELGPEAAAFILEGEGVEEDPTVGLSPENEVFTLEDVSEVVAPPEDPASFPAGPIVTEPVTAPPAVPSADFPTQRAPEAVPPPDPPHAGLSDTGPGAGPVNGEVPWAQKGPASPGVEPAPAPPITQEREPGPGQSASPPYPSPVSENIPVSGAQHYSQAPEPLPPEPLPHETAAEEQFSTETLADLYAQQGLVDKAAGIYRQILNQAPDNETVRLKLDALGAQTRPEEGTLQQVQPQEDVQPVSDENHGNGSTLSVLEGWLENAERIKRQ